MSNYTQYINTQWPYKYYTNTVRTNSSINYKKKTSPREQQRA